MNGLSLRRQQSKSTHLYQNHQASDPSRALNGPQMSTPGVKKSFGPFNSTRASLLDSSPVRKKNISGRIDSKFNGVNETNQPYNPNQAKKEVIEKIKDTERKKIQNSEETPVYYPVSTFGRIRESQT